MAADEPARSAASQEEKAAPDPRRKRKRRRRPRRKPGAAAGGGSNAQTKKTGAKGDGAKKSSGGAGASSSVGESKRKRQRRSGKNKRGGKPNAARTANTSAASRADPKRDDRKTAPRRQKIPTTREVSAGGVVYRKTDDGVEVVLASRRTRRGQLAWGLAKGGIEEGETKEVAAIREVREETGMTAEIEADLGDTKYMYVWDDIRIRKTVHFFLMRHTGGNAEDRDDEMEEIRWFPMERAIKRAAYRGERDMLVKASELLQ
ncbi:MAG TPA: NUDIX hydrolase [Actinomycetota bacterium]|jgi:8-oxo-dGTP pyrophosphatase MutT (NUDIX family)|nr:NUDIX hydrolase [Actinomycetota bacterium]